MRFDSPCFGQLAPNGGRELASVVRRNGFGDAERGYEAVSESVDYRCRRHVCHWDGERPSGKAIDGGK